MERTLKLLFALAFLAVLGSAQVVNRQIAYVTVAPSGVCSATGISLLTPDGTIYTCQNGTWGAVSGGGGGSPAGSAVTDAQCWASASTFGVCVSEIWSTSAAPATPAAGTGHLYIDSTSKNLAVKDDAGVVKHGVQTDTGTANNYISAISDAGAITKSQPSCATLSNAAASCATDATNASNISTGTLATARLPVGTPVLIQEQVLGGTAATVTFSSIPATYRNLRLTIQGRCDAASNSLNIYLQFNGDTAANYSSQVMQAAVTTVNAGQVTSNAKASFAPISCASALANTTGSTVLEIPNYTGTTFFKHTIASTSVLANTTIAGLYIASTSGLWASTAAINSIVLGLTSAGNFIAGSTFDLYAY